MLAWSKVSLKTELLYFVLNSTNLFYQFRLIVWIYVCRRRVNGWQLKGRRTGYRYVGAIEIAITILVELTLIFTFIVNISHPVLHSIHLCANFPSMLYIFNIVARLIVYPLHFQMFGRIRFLQSWCVSIWPVLAALKLFLIVIRIVESLKKLLDGWLRCSILIFFSHDVLPIEDYRS